MDRFVILPREAEPPCACGATRVAVYRDGIDGLMDNMGCELGLELVTGPLCPRCDGEEIERYRERPARKQGGDGRQAP
jgi:hypothetical protein